MNGKIIRIYKVSKGLLTLWFGFISFLLAFITWEELGLSNTCCKLTILVGSILVIILIATLYVFIKKHDFIWRRGVGYIRVIYGDLLNFSFSKKKWYQFKRKTGIVVIPVNTHFDTIVEDENVANPLVSSTTMHGMWIKKYIISMNISQQVLQERICQFLNGRGIGYENAVREKGNNRKYPLGTCALLEGNNDINFILLALSEFDDRNNAHTTKDGLINCVHSLVEFINEQCQGKTCYIPIMGTGRSRTGLSHKESLHIILSTLDLYKEKIFSPINVVIYNKDKDQVSIFDR